MEMAFSAPREEGSKPARAAAGRPPSNGSAHSRAGRAPERHPQASIHTLPRAIPSVKLILFSVFSYHSVKMALTGQTPSNTRPDTRATDREQPRRARMRNPPRNSPAEFPPPAADSKEQEHTPSPSTKKKEKKKEKGTRARQPATLGRLARGAEETEVGFASRALTPTSSSRAWTR
jgi:hypothetical protein